MARGDPGPKAGSEKSRSGRRQEIVAIARHTFAQRGYTNTSMRDIAESAGLLAGSLYSHFRSKSEILRLVLEPWLDAMVPAQQGALDSKGSGLERLTTMVRQVLAILADHVEELTILHYEWSDLVGLDDVAPIVARSNHLLDLWHQVILLGRADGSIRDDLEPEVLVRVVTSSLHSVVDTKRYGYRQAPLDSFDPGRLADQLVALFVGGLARRGDPACRTQGARGD